MYAYYVEFLANSLAAKQFRNTWLGPSAVRVDELLYVGARLCKNAQPEIAPPFLSCRNSVDLPLPFQIRPSRKNPVWRLLEKEHA